MSPLLTWASKILGDLRTQILLLISKYLSGDPTTGQFSQLQNYIGSISSSTTGAIKTGVNDLIQLAEVDGSIMVYSKAATAGIGQLIVQPGIHILTVEATVDSSMALPIMQVEGVGVATRIRHIRLDTSGSPQTSILSVDINGQFEASQTIDTTGSTLEMAITFVHPQDMAILGVA